MKGKPRSSRREQRPAALARRACEKANSRCARRPQKRTLPGRTVTSAIEGFDVSPVRRRPRARTPSRPGAEAPKRSGAGHLVNNPRAAADQRAEPTKSCGRTASQRSLLFFARCRVGVAAPEEYLLRAHHQHPREHRFRALRTRALLRPAHWRDRLCQELFRGCGTGRRARTQRPAGTILSGRGGALLANARTSLSRKLPLNTCSRTRIRPPRSAASPAKSCATWSFSRIPSREYITVSTCDRRRARAVSDVRRSAITSDRRRKALLFALTAERSQGSRARTMMTIPWRTVAGFLAANNRRLPPPTVACSRRYDYSRQARRHAVSTSRYLRRTR